ncbi:MAG: 3-hydroxyacyl-CoA dehydrogenase NAD-binding domain-containing protein, partial [Planctomycetales bacterium]
RIAVIGAGTMGRGIIETAAAHGLLVHAAEIDAAQRERAQAAIRKSIEKGIARGKLNVKDADEVTARIRWHADVVEAAVESRYAIEAIAEDESAKLDLFRRLDGACPPETVLASNTSSISITRLAAATGRADRVVGMHFFNPVPIMQPVEIVRGLATSEETVEITRQLARRMGKEPFAVADTPGFVVNRVLMPLINEAVFALQEGVADAKTIDSLMKLGCNHPMGPLELADFIGLDVCLSILRVLHRELGDPKFRPCPLLARTVDAGRLGRKSGRGFYEYEEWTVGSG